MTPLERVLRRLADQETARANAAGASAVLRQRRHEREDIDAYLASHDRGAFLPTQASGGSGPDPRPRG